MNKTEFKTNVKKFFEKVWYYTPTFLMAFGGAAMFFSGFGVKDDPNGADMFFIRGALIALMGIGLEVYQWVVKIAVMEFDTNDKLKNILKVCDAAEEEKDDEEIVIDINEVNEIIEKYYNMYKKEIPEFAEKYKAYWDGITDEEKIEGCKKYIRLAKKRGL